MDNYIETRREVMVMDDTVDFQMLRNLRDAGCNSLEIDRFFRFRTAGRLREQLQLLRQHRQFLLEQLHAAQQKIDSLDFLLYSMKNGESPCLAGKRIVKQNMIGNQAHLKGRTNEK